MTRYNVHAHWDADAKVWWAESDDIVGLVAEAPTYERLRTGIAETVPELMSLNGQKAAGGVEIVILTDEVMTIA